MKITMRNIVFAALMASLCGCGAKGPLFMPEEAAPVDVPAEPEEAAPAEADGLDTEPAESDDADASPADEVPAASTPAHSEG